MKKLSIVLALIMALSCFSLIASAADVTITLKAIDKDGAAIAAIADTTYTQAEGTVKASAVLAKAAKDSTGKYEASAVKATADAATVLEDVTVSADTTELFVVYTAVPSIKVTIHFVPAFKAGENDLDPDLNYHEHVFEDVVLEYTAKVGTTLTAADILENVKSSEKVDPKEFVLSETVFKNDVKFKSEVLAGDTAYAYDVYAVEINDVDNFAQVVASEAAGYDWGSVANANVTVINQIINGLKAAVASLCEADWPNSDKKDESTTAAAAVDDTPKTGSSAVAGAAIVVLALSAATAVVLRKKED